MRQLLLAGTGAALLAAAACASAPTTQTACSGADRLPPRPLPPVIPPPPANPLLAPWTGPHGGVPPFDQVKVEHFKPALEAAMDEQRDGDRGDRRQPRAAHLREHDRGAGERRADLRPRGDHLRHLEDAR